MKVTLLLTTLLLMGTVTTAMAKNFYVCDPEGTKPTKKTVPFGHRLFQMSMDNSGKPTMCRWYSQGTNHQLSGFTKVNLLQAHEVQSLIGATSDDLTKKINDLGAQTNAAVGKNTTRIEIIEKDWMDAIDKIPARVLQEDAIVEFKKELKKTFEEELQKRVQEEVIKALRTHGVIK